MHKPWIDALAEASSVCKRQLTTRHGPFLLLAGALLLTYGLLHPVYNSNDDAAFRLIFEGRFVPGGTPSGEVYFINLELGRVLAWLYTHAPGFYWYDLFESGAVGLAFVVAVRLLALTGGDRAFATICFAVVIFLAAIAQPQFTAAAILASGVGLLTVSLAVFGRLDPAVAGEDEESTQRLAEAYGRIIAAGLHVAPSIKVAEAALSGRRINESMGAFIAGKLVRMMSKADEPLSKLRAGILGLAFKENVCDLRNSRVPDVVRELRQFGIEALVCVPLVDAEQAHEEYGISLSGQDAFRDLHGLVLAVPHREPIAATGRFVQDAEARRRAARREIGAFPRRRAKHTLLLEPLAMTMP